MEAIDLIAWGWSSSFQEAFAAENRPGELPARVVEEQKGAYRVLTEKGELAARVTGRLRFEAGGRVDFPAVGDWVAIKPADGAAIITALLPRRTKISRQAAGRETQEQIIAANVDTVFVVTSHNEDLNSRRLERYMAAVRGGGAEPVVLINKADQLHGAEEKVLADIAALAPLANVLSVSALTGQGLEKVEPFLAAGKTVAVVGSSGVGKSTLINFLMGRDIFKTNEIRASDGRGQHTTTSRRLVKLESGAVLVDTPGMRELGLWEGAEGISDVFADIQALAAQCRFTDCAHQAEKACAVQSALADGTLEAGHFANYQKMLKEAAYQARRQGGRAAQAHKRRAKQIMKDYKKTVKEKWRD